MTTVYSSNSGRWPGSLQPSGDCIRATLRRSSPVLTRPTNSSMSFGLVPAASTRVGLAMICGTGGSVLRALGREGGLECGADLLERLRAGVEVARHGDAGEEGADRRARPRDALGDVAGEVEDPLDGLLVAHPARVVGQAERGDGVLRPVVERAFHASSCGIGVGGGRVRVLPRVVRLRRAEGRSDAERR